MRAERSPAKAPAKLVELVYELLDAHDDTARLADEFDGDVRWAAHLDYLQQLQRVGRELLAADLAPPETRLTASRRRTSAFRAAKRRALPD